MVKLFNVEISANQSLAFFIGIIGAYIYWFQLLLLTQKKLKVERAQFVGLAFAVLIAVLSWARFVFVTNDSFK